MTLSDGSISRLEAFSDSFDKYIVRPVNFFGLGGFVFDVERDTKIELKANITDHYVEDNSVLQDHSAISPLRLSLNTFVGELVNYQNSSEAGGVEKVVQKLTVLSDYIPDMISSAKNIRDDIINNDLSIPDLVENANDLWRITKNLNPGASRQQQAYLYFRALFEKKILVSVQTPFEYLPNMMIEGITAVQPEDSQTYSEFSLRLKQIRTARTELIEFDKEKYQSRSQQQNQAQKDNGKANGVVVEQSLVTTLGRLIF